METRQFDLVPLNIFFYIFICCSGLIFLPEKFYFNTIAICLEFSPTKNITQILEKKMIFWQIMQIRHMQMR